MSATGHSSIHPWRRNHAMSGTTSIRGHRRTSRNWTGRKITSPVQPRSVDGVLGPPATATPPMWHPRSPQHIGMPPLTDPTDSTGGRRRGSGFGGWRRRPPVPDTGACSSPRSTLPCQAQLRATPAAHPASGRGDLAGRVRTDGVSSSTSFTSRCRRFFVERRRRSPRGAGSLELVAGCRGSAIESMLAGRTRNQRATWRR